MRRVKKPRASTQYLYVVLVTVAVALKVVEVSTILFIVRKIPCDITMEDFGQTFEDHTKEYDLNIPRKYIQAYHAITDLCVATGNVCQLCPLNWNAFNGKCYFFSADRHNRSLGEADCVRRKAELIFIEDLTEQDFILSQTSSNNGHFWIGLTKNVTHWYWKRGGKFQGNLSVTSEEHQCATFGKDLSAESCFNPNKWICKKNMSRFEDMKT